MTDGQLAGNPIRIPAAQYREWFAALPDELTEAMVAHWGGPPPGELFVDRSQNPDGEIVVAAIQSGNIVILVQPPRGFGENPVAIYHDPPRSAAEPPLPGHLPVAATRFRRACRRPPR